MFGGPPAYAGTLAGGRRMVTRLPGASERYVETAAEQGNALAHAVEAKAPPLTGFRHHLAPRLWLREPHAVVLHAQHEPRRVARQPDGPAMGLGVLDEVVDQFAGGLEQDHR
jgi:hypothetical protein